MNKFKVYTYWCLSDNRMKMYMWIFTAVVVFHNSMRLLLYFVPLPKTFSSTCWTNPVLRRLLALGHVHLPHPSSCEVVKAWSKVVKAWRKVVNVWCKVVQVWRKEVKAWNKVVKAWSKVVKVWCKVVQAWSKVVKAWSKVVKVLVQSCTLELASIMPCVSFDSMSWQ